VNGKYLLHAVKRCLTGLNYPTFAEAYTVAALDVMNKMHTLSRFRG
jgi:hypothetical protein